MERVEFVALGMKKMEPALEQARKEGWRARDGLDPLLLDAGITGSTVRLEHPDAPYPLLLVQTDDSLCVTAVQKNGVAPGVKPGTALYTDEELASRVIDDAPVVASLVADVFRSVA